MIDKVILESLSPEEQDVVKGAIRSLAMTGILLKQRDSVFTRLLNGSSTESVEEVAVRVLDYRKSVHGLIQLHQYGMQLLEELNQ